MSYYYFLKRTFNLEPIYYEGRIKNDYFLFRTPVPLVQIEAGAHDIAGGVGVLDILPLGDGVEPDVGAAGGGDPSVPGGQLTNEGTEV